MSDITILRARVNALESAIETDEGIIAAQATRIADLEARPTYDSAVVDDLVARVLAIEGELSNPQ